MRERERERERERKRWWDLNSSKLTAIIADEEETEPKVLRKI